MHKATALTRRPWYAAWQRRSWGERQLFLEAWGWLGLMRLLVVLLPFQWVLFGLRLRPCPTPAPTAMGEFIP